MPKKVSTEMPSFSRRGFLATAAAGLGSFAIAQNMRADIVHTDFRAYLTAMARFRRASARASRQREWHERAFSGAGYETPGRPAVLLLHGFPELAYSWRKVMPPLAAAGYHVIAPDQRGYGRTIGWDDFIRRSGSVSHTQHDARCDCADLRTGTPLGRDGRWARCRRAGRLLVRAHTAGYFPHAYDYEFSV